MCCGILLTMAIVHKLLTKYKPRKFSKNTLFIPKLQPHFNNRQPPKTPLGNLKTIFTKPHGYGNTVQALSHMA